MSKLSDSIKPIKPIKIQEIQFLLEGKTLTYAPKDDITNIELAHLLQLFIHGTAQGARYNSYDYGEYIERHKLERHFTENTL